jgi:hypothetical protein
MELTPEQLAAARELLRTELADEIKAEFAEENKETIDKIAEERLATMKSNMDKMAKKLEESAAAARKAEEDKKRLEKERMEAEGKHLELREMEVKELEAKYQAAQERITALTRDQELNRALAGLEFKTDTAREMAFNDIVRSLVQTDEGVWLHRSGVSIEEYLTKVFVKDPSREFLFKSKDNSGAGTQPKAGVGQQPIGKLKDKSFAELMALAESGALGQFQQI